MGVAERLSVQHRLGQIGARIEIGERSDDRRNVDAGKMKRESEFRKVHLGNVHIRREIDVRQKRAQLLPAPAARAAHIGTRQQQAQILLQSTVDRILQRERQDSRNRL